MFTENMIIYQTLQEFCYEVDKFHVKTFRFVRSPFNNNKNVFVSQVFQCHAQTAFRFQSCYIYFLIERKDNFKAFLESLLS